MSTKQLEILKTVISETYDSLQTLQVQATAQNIKVLAVGLGNLRTVYNTLTTLYAEQTGGENDGHETDSK